MVKQAQSKQKIIDKMVEAGLTEKIETERNVKFVFTDCGEKCEACYHREETFLQWA
jgi:ATP-binding cassette subfamily F protein 2